MTQLVIKNPDNTVFTDRNMISCEACSLSGLCLTHGLTSEELTEFERVVELSPHIRRHQFLYRAGQPLKSLFAIKSGSFKSTLTDREGNLHVTGFYMPGEVVGFDGLSEQFYQYDLAALEDARVCELPMGKLDALINRFPTLQREMRRIGSHKQNSLQQLLLLVAKRPVEERLAAFLLNMIQRYRRRGLTVQRFRLPMGRNEIANYLGMAPETLSRQFSRFENNEWIKVDNRDCEICDELALQHIANIFTEVRSKQNMSIN